jgi:hypothetical protein
MFAFKLFLASLSAGSVAAGSLKNVDTAHRQLQQPSAKFAAGWSTETIVAGSCIGTPSEVWTGSDTAPINCTALDLDAETSSNLVFSQVAPLNRMKIPNDKEVLITVSAQIDLFTMNTATSKGNKNQDSTSIYGNIGGTKAVAGINVGLFAFPSDGADPIQCAPGDVTLASRMIELRNLMGVNVTYEDCYCLGGDEGCNVEANLTCVDKIADVEFESQIALAMQTVASHSFQFVCVDLESDTYDIMAAFYLTSDAMQTCNDSLGGTCADVDDYAAAKVVLGTRMVTAQQVRAVQGSLDWST